MYEGAERHGRQSDHNRRTSGGDVCRAEENEQEMEVNGGVSGREGGRRGGELCVGEIFHLKGVILALDVSKRWGIQAFQRNK